jgi:hypothetical protein
MVVLFGRIAAAVNSSSSAGKRQLSRSVWTWLASSPPDFPGRSSKRTPGRTNRRSVKFGAAFSGRGRDGMMQRSLSLGAAMPAAEAESGVRDKLQCRF